MSHSQAALPIQPDDAAAIAGVASALSDSEEGIRQRIGQLTRTLHTALRELGYERELMDARDNLPDARDRLAYIARVTGEAAEKVLNAVDRARSVQQELTEQAGLQVATVFVVASPWALGSC